jgi:hypothetical protein
MDAWLILYNESGEIHPANTDKVANIEVTTFAERLYRTTCKSPTYEAISSVLYKYRIIHYSF